MKLTTATIIPVLALLFIFVFWLLPTVNASKKWGGGRTSRSSDRKAEARDLHKNSREQRTGGPKPFRAQSQEDEKDPDLPPFAVGRGDKETYLRLRDVYI